MSGFSQRSVLIEGWAYTDDAHSRHGEGGKNYSQVPFHDQELFALNQRAFTDPSEETLAQLRDRDVRWLFADTRRAKVSEELSGLARLEFHNGSVSIYALE